MISQEKLTAFSNLSQEFKLVKERYRTKFINLFQELFTEIFESGVKEISWHQYTPYFNDGEPCYFSVNDWSLSFDNEEYLDKKHPLYNDKEEIRKLIGNFSKDSLREMFGDHAKIVFTKSGCSVLQYDHE